MDSITYTEETLATFHKVMSSEFYFEDRIRIIARLYSWLIEAWLEIRNPPPGHVKDLVEELEFNI